MNGGEGVAPILKGAYRALGDTGIVISPLGFGCASAWGRELVPYEQARALFARAYQLGVRYFDTGYSYGDAEARIGRILRDCGEIRREECFISTKFGTRVVGGKIVKDWSPAWMRKSVAESLERMGLDHLDMLLCHSPRMEDLSVELLSEMRALKDEGLVRAIGVSMTDDTVHEYVRKTKCVDAVMLGYNVMSPGREAAIEKLAGAGIGVIAGAPLAHGTLNNRFLSVKSRKDLWYLARTLANFRKQLAQSRKYRFLNAVPGMSGAQVALKYVLDNPLVSSAVAGTTACAHLDDNVRALSMEIPADVLQKIREAQGARV